MIETKDLFVDGQGTLVERQGLLVLALVIVEVCQVVERPCCFGVLRAKRLFFDGQGSLVERQGLLVLALVLVEVCQVVECGRGIVVFGAKRLFFDGQGALVERQGLLVLALVRVEGCQVVEQVTGVGMIAPVPCFPNGERVLHERLGFSILSAISQIVPCVIQQCCCFIKGEVPLLDEFFTDQCLRKISLAAGPGRRLIERKYLVGRSYRPFCPVALRLLVHLIIDHRLYQAMDGERVGCGIAADERVFEQFSEGCIQPIAVGNNGLQNGTKMGCALDDQLFRNGIGGKEGTEAYQFNRCGIGSFDVLKGQRPGGGNRVRMPGNQSTTPL